MNINLSHFLDCEMNWCTEIINARFEQYFSAEEDPKKQISIENIAMPEISSEDSPYSTIVKKYALGFDERLLLTLALLPHLRPQALDVFFLNNGNLGRPYTEFGGWKGKSHSGFLPTCETALFLLAGENLGRRLEVMRLFDMDSTLLKEHLVALEYGEAGEPANSAALRIPSETLEYLSTGLRNMPDYSMHFPAKHITTELKWDDLVLSGDVMDDVSQVTAWIEHSEKILDDWGLRKNVKPGYRVLFYGPPGTGKTLTATLIGTHTGMDVYRIDLAQVISKYIGETEKNLSGIFDQAERHKWILFFDEADSLFGARTQASNANDRAANQEIAYLLQRIEDFPGVVILASNLKSNIDDAFSRRFQSSIYFPMPEPSERFRLWTNIFQKKEMLASDVNFLELAEKYELAGGALINVARFAVIRAVREGRRVVNRSDIEMAVTKEFRKEGKMA